MKKLTSVFALIALLGVVSFAYANEGTTKNQEKTTGRQTALERVQALNDEKEELSSKKCQGIEKRIENKVTNFNNQKDKHLVSYNKTKTKIQALITKLDGKGYNTKKLKDDLVLFEDKIKQFSEDYVKYISLLDETKTYPCGKPAVELKAKLTEARAQLKVVHEDAVAIRTFYAKTIRVDVKEIKAQKTTSSENGENTNTTTSEGE